MVRLVKEDWTHLGGRMGTEYTTVIWDKFFSTEDLAKEYAEEDNDIDHPMKIKWEKQKGKSWFSGDLSSHAYYIYPVKVEK